VALEDGQQVLAQLVVKETTVEPEGSFGEVERVRYRVFERVRTAAGTEVRFTLLRVTEDQRVVTEAFGTYPTQVEIPVAEVPTSGRVALFQSEPPLADVGHLTLAHYQQWSDYATSMHMTCVPILFTAGFEMTDEAGVQIEVGPNTGLNSPNPDGKAAYVSHDGAALTACKTALDDLKADIGSLGLAMLAPQKRSAETFGAKRLDRAAESSALAVTARGVQDACERALGFHARYLRLPSGGSLTITREYEEQVLDAATMQAYAVLADKLGVPDEAIVQMLVEGRRLPEDTVVAEMAEAMRGAREARADIARVEAEVAKDAQADAMDAAAGGSATYAVGDRVRVRPGKSHDAATAEATGTVAVVNGTAIGIRFDGMDGVHKWYVAEELMPVTGAAARSASMVGM